MPESPPRLQLAGLSLPGQAAVDLCLAAAQCLALTGPSGSGKTRLLRAIADLDPAAGGLWLDGVPREVITPCAWRRQVAFLPAANAWWAPTVAGHFPGDWSAATLTDLGLDPALAERDPVSLSSGERQRLALARLLANRPRVLLLDEPTANLDPDNAARVEALIAGLRHRDGVAVLWVSHDAAQLARVADAGVELAAGGRVVAA